jgi:transglutaminase-like putative cysteine protease
MAGHVGPNADVAVVVPAGGSRAYASSQTVRPGERPILRLVVFSALALYGTVRWASLLSPAPGWRLFGLLVLAIAVAGLGPELRARSRVGTVGLAVVAVLLMFMLAGVPARWVTHLRIAASAQGIGSGLSGLPGALVPYNGVNQWLRTVILLGGAILLIDAALMLAFASRSLTETRRAVVALPLVALAVVPCTLVAPQLPYVQGLLLFVLLAAFMWAERVRAGEALMAGVVAAIAVIAGMLAAPRLDPHSPWLNYRALAGSLAPAHVDAFDWTQRYGPLHWPRSDTEVLDVKARFPDYWKAENLDAFDGRRWVSTTVQTADPDATVSPVNLARWTQTLTVTIRSMKTFNVIAAGAAASPLHVSGTVSGGSSPGTWLTSNQLGPGDSYTVRTYTPHPSPAELQTAGTNYPPAILAADLSLSVPIGRSIAPQPTVQQILFQPFGAPTGIYGPAVNPVGPALAASPYARAYALARRLSAAAVTPYDFALSVQRYLGSPRFRYYENTPRSAYPLQTFLFRTHRGYCQQFAGAMALLLRMGGVPARVATGFTTGTYSASSHQYLVTDVDAHAWVEVWFPGYGWVRFDPTPAAAPARGGRSLLPVLPGHTTSPAARSGAFGHRVASNAGATPTTHRTGSSSSSSVVLVVLLVVALLILAVVIKSTLVLHEAGPDELLTEFERALRRCGRPIAPGTTLATLERRYQASPEAAAYVRALRLARFSDGVGRPTGAQRRALRAQMREGLGLIGRLRALWALPPQLTVRRSVSDPWTPGIHST